jgi:CBS domain-containing protein
MLVSGFMVPKDKVCQCSEWDPIENIVAMVTDNKVSAVVVMDKDDKDKPVGLVTKTDLVLAYKQGISLHQKVQLIMVNNLKTIPHTANRDQVAKMFEATQFHHAIVVDGKTGKFMGVVSAWDVVTECARDARAWPYSRTEDGKVHPLHAEAH